MRYLGEQTIERTRGVATGTDGSESWVCQREEYDAFDRLAGVTEVIPKPKKPRGTMSHSYEIFATRGDVLALLGSVEETRAIQYVLVGLFDREPPIVATAAHEIENLGIAQSGDQNLVPAFLVQDPKSKVNVRRIPQRRGGVKYAIDQLKNPKSVVISAGGEYREEALIAGQIGTVSSDKDSLALLDVFAYELRKRFIKIQAYWVGKCAARALESGLRLTANITAPKEADLSRAASKC